MSKKLGKTKADSIDNEDHKLGDLLDYLLMPDTSGISLEDVICWAVVENVDTLQIHLAKCKKVLKQANKTHAKLLTKMAKLKQVEEESLPDKAAQSKAQEEMRQAGDQLQWVRETIAHHTMEISEIQDLLRERESSEEESSSPEDLSPGSGNPTDATQEEDVEMEDIEDTSNPPQGTVTETDPTADKAEDELSAVGGIDLVTPGGDQPIMEGGTTPITPEDDKLLEYEDEEENQAGAVTPSGVVAESLSKMNMDSPTPTPPSNDPPGNKQKA